MMNYEEWLRGILNAARNIASREFQEETWLHGGKTVSSPDEVYLTLMEDFTADLFVETYGKNFSSGQLQAWNEFRSRLQNYYDNMPPKPDPQRVLDDPKWDLVRRAADRFVLSFAGQGGPGGWPRFSQSPSA